jgi:uncharacterized membrane protein
VTAPTRTRATVSGDRGSVVPFVAVCLTLVVASAALAIDLGGLAVAARELRTVADLAALDAVRLLDGSPSAAQQVPIEEAAVRSASRNGFQAGVDGTLIVVLGTYDRTTGTFVASGPSDVPDAVRVELHQDVDNQFAPGSFGIDRAAVASSASSGRAGIAIAATALTPTTSEVLVLDTLLGEVLGGPVGLTTTDWEELAAAPIDLVDLATTGAGLPPEQVQELLDQTWSLGALVGALDQMVLPAGAASAIDDLVVVGTGPSNLRLGDAFDVVLTDPDARDLSISVAELLRTAALLSARDETFPVVLDPGALGAAAITLEVHVAEAPGYAFGSANTTVQSARLLASAEVTLADPVLIAGAEPATATIPLVLDSGRSEAALADLPCAGAPTPTGVDVEATTAPVSVVLGQPIGSLEDGVTGPATVTIVSEPAPPDPPTPVARVDAHVTIDLPAASGSLAFVAPFGWEPVVRFDDPGDPEALLVVSGADLDAVQLAPGSIPLTTIADGVASDVAAALPPLAVSLLAALGADLGAVDVSLPAASCRTAELVG